MRLRTVGLTLLSALAFTAVAASSASATTVELNGVTQNSSVSTSVSISVGFTIVFGRTDGTLANTCTAATVEGAYSSPFTGTKVTGATSTLSFSGCSAGNPTVHKAGKLYVEHESGTTNGNVFSEEAEVTVPTSLGFTVNCKTGGGTQLGTVTGVSSGNATMHVNAVLNCGFLLPSARLTGTLTVTTSGFAVSA